MFKCITTWICLLAYFTFTLGDVSNDTGQLVAIFVIYRHGDRVIIQPYPKDPYRDESYWPAGWGQLTNLGKLQQYELGEWIRDRYKDFLPAEYSENDIYVRSTDVDRTLMSAEANLAGLYPPEGKQVWDKDVPWQPIPIHTRPETEDYLVAMKKSCPNYDLLLQELLQSKEFVDLTQRYKPLMDYVTENTGASITSFESLEYIYNTLSIERENNLTLPAWAKDVFPDKMKPPSDLSFAIQCYTPELARLKTGPFFNQLLGDLFNVTESVKLGLHSRKIWMYSGHDVTIANILQTLQIFEYHSPPFSSTILFEVRYRGNSQFYLNVLYKNSSVPQKMTLRGCHFDCSLEHFVGLLDHIHVNVKDWERECKLSFLSMVKTIDKEELIVVAGALFVSLIVFAVILKIIYSKYSKTDAVYLRLPDDDEQV